MKVIDYLKDILYVDNWDWIAFLVSSISLIVAIYSFCVARKTLASQKNTEKNTQPRINNGVQKLLMEKFSIFLFDSFAKIAALKNILSRQSYHIYPSEEVLTLSKLDIDAFHLELFYEEPLFYYPFDGLKGKVIHYNELIDVLNSHLKDNHIPIDFLDSSITNILIENLDIYGTWKGCMSMIFGYKIDDFVYIIKERILSGIEAKETPYYCDSSDFQEYLSLFNTQEDKDTFIMKLNSKIMEYTEMFENYMLPK